MVLRSTSSKFAFWALAALVAVFMGDALLRANLMLVVRTAALFGFGLWAAWVLLYRMSIRIEPDGIRVINILRTTHIPWSRIRSITRRVQIRIAFFDSLPGNGDREIECWGSPFPKKPGTTRVRAGGSSQSAAEQRDPALYALDLAWQNAGGSSLTVDGVVRRSWDLAALIPGVVLLIGTIVVNAVL